ncbi:MAG: TauD/TfdA family dioxygenase [bacterium]|nr:TauD/TfdA family dioxygenase [bacterium]
MSAGSDRPFETRPLGAIGVEIEGLELRSEMSDETFAALRRTVVEEGLVLFRDQPLDPEVQIALGKRFGPIEQLVVGGEDEEPSMVKISNLDADGNVRANDSHFMQLITINEGWHTDSSFREVPASFSVFSCVVAPEEGGDTMWAHLQRPFDALDDVTRKRLVGRSGVHDYAAAYRARGNDEGGIVGFDSDPLRHPLLREHPESGRPGLYMSEHMSEIEGLSPEESESIRTKLLALVTADDNTYRHHWSVGDVAIWDNRSMLHRAQGFDERFPRVMHHVRVAGFEAPIAWRPR